MNVKDFALVLKDAGMAWYAQNAFRFAASLAYYTAVSLAPLVLITVSILGLIYSRDAARDQFQGQMQEVVGEEGGKAIGVVLKNAPEQESSGIIATVLGVAAFLGGFTGVFFELQAALNLLWEIPPGPQQTLWASLRKMFFSVGSMVVIGFLLLVSLIVNAGLSTIGQLVTPEQFGLILIWKAVNFILTLAVTTLLFALIFKFLPDARIAWNDVWIGAAITALLFSIGKFAIGEYLGHSGVASSYGAAGSIIVLLLWVYYSALILFFGAEVTRVIANRFGSKIVPTTGAAPGATQRKSSKPFRPAPVAVNSR